MGLGMYVNEKFCLGKCYGYNGYKDEIHLDSLDYLISISAFAEWRDNDISYDDMNEYFHYIQKTEKITLSNEQFDRFIKLYFADRKKVRKLPYFKGMQFNSIDRVDDIPDAECYLINWE